MRFFRLCAMALLAGLATAATATPASAELVASAGISVSVTVLPHCGTAGCQAGDKAVKEVFVQRGVARDPANPPPSVASVTRMMVVSY